MFNADKANKSVTQKLIRHFYNHSLNFLLEPQELESLNWDEQQILINKTIKNEIVKKYPVSSEFCRLYLKKIISYLEPNQEIHDDIYTILCTVLKSSTQEEFCFRHYIIGNDLENMITIKETKNMVVNGTTGMRTWQAALMLADFMICNKDLLAGKKILELGSGVGFTGIAVVKNCDVKSMLLTDCHMDVIRAISDNIKINFLNMDEVKNDTVTIFKSKNKCIGVMMLDWNCIEALSDDIVPDVLIGADIIYDPDILKPLCKVIRNLFDRNLNLEVYIANIIRNEDTFKCFSKTLDSMNLESEEVSQSDCVFVEWDCSAKKCLLKIKVKC